MQWRLLLNSNVSGIYLRGNEFYTTPKFCINAWLERKNPILELRESFTNRTVFSVKGELLRDWIDSGEIEIADFSDSNPNIQELVKDLLLKSILTTSPQVTNKKNIRNNIIKFPILRSILSQNRNIYYISKPKIICLLSRRLNRQLKRFDHYKYYDCN